MQKFMLITHLETNLVRQLAEKIEKIKKKVMYIKLINFKVLSCKNNIVR